jgi:hypothetical protein
MSRRAAAVVASAAVVLVAAGCESSQDKSARLAKEGAKAIAGQHGLEIRRRNPFVHIMQTGVVADQNGTAAAVMLKNTSRGPLGTVPIAINVIGAGGKSVFQNNLPGLEPSLVSIAALPPGAELTWVNDQVQAGGKNLTVTATAGASGDVAPIGLPQIIVEPPKLIYDPTSGWELTGRITNKSQIPQLKLFVYAVAWRGKQLVSAGRGAIQRLLPGHHADYHIYPIGNPKAAQFTIVAPPTVLR